MTDGFASKLYSTLFMPSSAVVGEKLG
jgi:hypothetical protein